MELVWTVIPVLLVLLLAVPTVYYTYKFGDVCAMGEVDEEGDSSNLVVDVTAKLYWWEFEYPELGIITAQNRCADWRKSYFNLLAADVKHSFWIPAIGGKLDKNVENDNILYTSPLINSRILSTFVSSLPPIAGIQNECLTSAARS